MRYPWRIGHPEEASPEFFTAFLLKVMGEKQLCARLLPFDEFYILLGLSIIDLETVFGVEIFSEVLLLVIS